MAMATRIEGMTNIQKLRARARRQRAIFTATHHWERKRLRLLVVLSIALALIVGELAWSSAGHACGRNSQTCVARS